MLWGVGGDFPRARVEGVVMAVTGGAFGTRPLIGRGMFPGIISGDASAVNPPPPPIWTTAMTPFAQAVLHQ